MTTADDRLADLLEQWENAAGPRPTPEDLCRDTPEYLPAFRNLLRHLGIAGLVTVDEPRPAGGPPTGFRAGRYTALEYHAAGGLGVVYRAHDEELNRTVALKCMKAGGGADSPAGRRFLLEAEVTSRLDHPGIAPVHGRGATADGRPYYAMRFIQGETLQDAARRFHTASLAPGERNVEQRRLLRAFVGVCETVAYAHARGVIHRDLKPANIMVGPFGEVLVMDWGLSRQVRNAECGVRSEEDMDECAAGLPPPPSPLRTPHSANDELTQLGQAKGSPAFMSPEQAAGDWDRVGPASDVYSLGSTLYYLLTGRPPYLGGTGHEVITRVREGRFPPPRTVRPDVPAALDAVCRKAMAVDPAGRYPTGHDLAADVDRWLADEPVSAWREPPAVRARRWARRHRTLVTATSAALVVGLVLLAVYSYRLDRKNRDLIAANEREVEQRVRADERFRLALEGTDHLVSDIQTQLVRAPGTRAVRESLLRDAMARLDRLLQRADETREANRVIVRARLRLGDLYRDVEQNPTKAAAEYARGLELARTLRDQHPDDPEVTRDVVAAIQRLGQVEARLGRYGRAADLYAEADRLIVEPGPDRARHLTRQAELAQDTGDTATARAMFAQARSLWEQQTADPDTVAERAAVLLALGHAADQAGHFPEAITHHTASLALWQDLQALRPGDVTVRRQQALAHSGLARAHLQMGEREPAAEHARSFFDRAKALADLDPDNGEALLELARAHGEFALTAALHGDLAAADEHFEQSLRLAERLAALDPNDLLARRNHAVALAHVAAAARARQRYPEAAARFTQAIGIVQGILTTSPERTVSRADLAGWQQELGLTHLRHLPDKDAGLAALAESVATWQELIAADPDNLSWRARTLEAYRLLGYWQKTARKAFDAAETTFRAGLSAAERIPTTDRDRPIIRRPAGLLRVDLAAALLDRNQRDAARELAETAIAEWTRDTGEHPADVVTCELLERGHAFLADLHRRQNRMAESLEHTRHGIAAARHGLALDPDSATLRQGLQIQLARQADQVMNRDPARALGLFREALQQSPRLPPDLAETAVLRTRIAGFEARAGDCCEMLNRPADGLEHYQRAVDHHSRVAELEPAGPGIPGILAYDHRRMAEMKLTLLDFPGAVREYEQAAAVLEGMRTAKRRFTLIDLQTDSLVKSALPFARTLPAALETLDAALKSPADQRLNALRLRVARLLAADREAEAVATVERMVAGPDADHEVLARAAVEYARLAGRGGPKAAEYARRSMEMLGRAKSAGYFRGPDDVAWLDWEPLFAPLRAEEAFRSLVSELQTGKK